MDDGGLPARRAAGFDSVSPSFDALLRQRHCLLLLRSHFIGRAAPSSLRLRIPGSLWRDCPIKFAVIVVDG